MFLGGQSTPKFVIQEYAEGFALRLALILSIYGFVLELETGTREFRSF